ncbi:hypothetical protein K8R20_00695, partial [bacterium]|nr:hypothetical protein [bacterium]
MISYIQGKVLKTYIGKQSYIDILISSGVGYRVFVPTNTKVLPVKS